MKINKKELLRSLKFLAFSVSAGVIQLGSFAIMDIFMESYILKSYIALTLSVLWNFTFNRKFTFKSAANVPVAMLKTLGYYVVFGPLSIHLGDMYLVKTLGWNEILIQAITMVVNFVTEFLFQRFVVYRNNVDTAKNKKDMENQPQDGNEEDQAENIDFVKDDTNTTDEQS